MNEHPPASELSKQWRELTKRTRELVANIRGEQLWISYVRMHLTNQADALIAAADACDRLEAQIKTTAENGYKEFAAAMADNAKLRELLAEARKHLTHRLDLPDAEQVALRAAIDAALKEKL